MFLNIITVFAGISIGLILLTLGLIVSATLVLIFLGALNKEAKQPPQASNEPLVFGRRTRTSER